MVEKDFPATVFVSTDLPDKRLIVTNSQQDLEELDDESTDNSLNPTLLKGIQ